MRVIEELRETLFFGDPNSWMVVLGLSFIIYATIFGDVSFALWFATYTAGASLLILWALRPETYAWLLKMGWTIETNKELSSDR